MPTKNIINKSLSLIIIIIIINFGTINIFSNCTAQDIKKYEVNLEKNLQLEMISSATLIGDFAKNLRFEIDHYEGIGDGNGFIDQEELDAYESEKAFEALNEINAFKIDDTAVQAVSYSMELDGVGTDAWSTDPIEFRLKGTATFPDVDPNASHHKLVKRPTGEPYFIKITFDKKWKIKTYTGINNSELSDDKRSVEGYEFPPPDSGASRGYPVVVEFEKSTKAEDEGWKAWVVKSKNYIIAFFLIIIALIVIILYYRSR